MYIYNLPTFDYKHKILTLGIIMFYLLSWYNFSLKILFQGANKIFSYPLLISTYNLILIIVIIIAESIF